MALTEVERDLVSGLSAARIHGHVQKLCSFGSRHLGSPGHEQSQWYLEDQLSKMGLEVRAAPFEIAVACKASAQLRIVSPQERSIRCLANYRSAASPPGGILTSHVVDVGEGMALAYEGKDVAGAIVLATEGGGHPIPKSELAAQKDALGCIWVNRRPGGFISTYGLGRFGAKLPVVSISYEDGQYLRELLARGGLSLSLAVDTDLARGTGKHVIGILPGKTGPDQVYVLCAHYETVPGSPGANDNATGVGVVLETLRVLRERRPNRTIWGFLTTGEEGGAPGMRAYMEANRAALQKMKAVFNLDVLGEGTTLRLVTEGRWPDRTLFTSDELNQLLLSAADDLGYVMLRHVSHMGLADTEPFVAAGVPGAWIEKTEWRYNHTDRDVPETIDANSAKIAADILIVALWRLDQHTNRREC